VTLAVVEESKEFHHLQVCTDPLPDHQTMVEHPRPMARAMVAPLVDFELTHHLFEQFRFVEHSHPFS
jgi:hypothetical protein